MRKNNIMQHGQLITMENGTQYFVCGNNRIKVSEHFAEKGKQLDDLIADVIRHIG